MSSDHNEIDPIAADNNVKDVSSRQGSARDQIKPGTHSSDHLKPTQAPAQETRMSAGSDVPLESGPVGSSRGGPNTSTNGEVESEEAATVRRLLQPLSQDVYALTVASIIRGIRGTRLAHVLFAMLLSAVMQLGILVLLWLVVTLPPDDTASKDEDIWEQLGQLQGQICWMQGALNNSGVDITKWSSTKGATCSGAWPNGKPSRSLDWQMSLCPELPLQADVPSWEVVQPCLLHDTGSPYTPNPTPDYCSDVLQILGSDLKAFGRGLLYPRTDQLRPANGKVQVAKRLQDGGWKLSNLACCPGSDARVEGRVYDTKYKSYIEAMYGNSFHSYYDYSTSMADENSPDNPECLHLQYSNNTAPTVTSNENCEIGVRSHARCIGNELAALVSAYSRPATPLSKLGVASLLLNMLAFLALAVFAHDEVRRATTLCHVAATAAGILPLFYRTPESTASSVPGISPDATITSTHSIVSRSVLAMPYISLLLRCTLLIAPIIQLCVAMLVLLSASLMSLVQEYQASNIQVIVNSVALGFVLEIDNKIGQTLLAQHPAMMHKEFIPIRSGSGRLGCHTCMRLVCLKEYFKAFVGHVYMIFIGLMVVIEPLLLTPHISALLTIACVIRGSSTSGGFVSATRTLKQLAIDSAWGRFVVQGPGVWYLAVTTICDKSSNFRVCVKQVIQQVNEAAQANYADWQPSLIDSICSCWYSIMLASFILVQFYKPLPTVAFRWPTTLLALQSFTGVLMGLLSMNWFGDIEYAGYLSLFTFALAAGCLAFVTWVCMFMIWPTCHRWNFASATQPQPCCCSCSICCATSCCRNRSGSFLEGPCSAGCNACCTSCCGACCDDRC